MLSDHLARVKLEHAEREHALKQEVSSLKKESAAALERTNALEDMLAQRDFELEQTKAEMSRKWRIQEREDWKQLVTRLQRERSRLVQHNEELKNEVEALRGGGGAAEPDRREEGQRAAPAALRVEAGAQAASGAVRGSGAVLSNGGPQSKPHPRGGAATGPGERNAEVERLRARLAEAEERTRHEVAQRDAEIRRLRSALSEAHSELQTARGRLESESHGGGLQDALSTIVTTLRGLWTPKRGSLPAPHSPFAV